jgi:hypothetical protein
MSLTRKQALKTMIGSGVAAATGLATGLRPGTALAATGTRPAPVIERDVVVLGGGSSGTYTAVRLRDLGRSVLVVERKDRLGGHTETFHDPATGATTDIGVIVWHDMPEVRDYFARFDVPLVPYVDPGDGDQKLADFRTGQVVPGYEIPVPVALTAYRDLLQSRYPYLDAGFELPDPVPAELLAPFSDFITANGLESIAQLVFRFGQGLGDLMNKPALYVMKNFSLTLVNHILTGAIVATARTDNSEIYEKATTFLGEDVLLGSTLVTADRDRAEGVVLRIDTPQGPRTVRAGALVVTAPPVPTTLAPLGLDTTESALFGRFRPGYYYTGLLRLPGVPDSTTVRNVGADTPNNIAVLPGIYRITRSSVPGLFDLKYGSTTPLSAAQVKANVLADVDRLQTAGTLPATSPSFAAFRSHSPFELTVSADDIAGGFYRRLNALQGHRHTFYNGGAFHTHDSSLLWQFTEGLLPRIAG